MESLDNNLKDMTDIVNNRIYYRISNWYSVLNLLPFSKKIIEIWQEMLGVENKDILYIEKNISIFTKMKIIISFLLCLINTPKKMKELNVFFSNQLFRYNKKIKECNDINSLLKLYDSIKEELVQRWDITLVNDMYTFIYTFLAGKKNKQYIGRCFVEKGKKYIRVLSSKSSNGYRVEAMCFDFPVEYSTSGNMTKMFSPDNAFSSIDFDGFYVEDYPLLCNDLFSGFRGKKVIDNLVEITEEEYFAKMDEYLDELKEKMKNGFFDTSKEK